MELDLYLMQASVRRAVSMLWPLQRLARAEARDLQEIDAATSELLGKAAYELDVALDGIHTTLRCIDELITRAPAIADHHDRRAL